MMEYTRIVLNYRGAKYASRHLHLHLLENPYQTQSAASLGEPWNTVPWMIITNLYWRHSGSTLGPLAPFWQWIVNPRGALKKPLEPKWASNLSCTYPKSNGPAKDIFFADSAGSRDALGLLRSTWSPGGHQSMQNLYQNWCALQGYPFQWK